MPFPQIATRIGAALAVTLAPLSVAPFYEERSAARTESTVGLPGGQALDEAHAEGANYRRSAQNNKALKGASQRRRRIWHEPIRHDGYRLYVLRRR
jgi:hypothetical protein